MNEVSQTGRTILFVSHNMAAVQNLCTRGILLRQGKIVFDGAIDEAVRDYLTHLTEGAGNAFTDNPERSGNKQVQLTGAQVLNQLHQPAQHLVAGEPALFAFTYTNPSRTNRAIVTFTIFNHLGVAVSNFDMKLTNFFINDLKDEGRFTCHIPNLPLPVGQYRIAVAVLVDGQRADLIPNALVFDVSSSTFFRTGRTPDIRYCSSMIAHHWQHEPIEAPK
jgi:lipopolysaccharide transport system ATP-binding protein